MGSDMNDSLLIGFKGRNNASAILVQSLSPRCFLLTNSFAALEKEIEGIETGYSTVYLFGVDKNLKDSFRIEKKAEKDGIRMETCLDTDGLREKLEAAGIHTELSGNPTKYLCNEAYWHLLRKFDGKAVLIHIPTIRHYDESWISKIRQALQQTASQG